jgi:hypothetical protein
VEFTGAARGGAVIKEADITQKSLEIAIKPGAATLEQWEQIGKAMENAKANEINFKIKFIR